MSVAKLNSKAQVEIPADIRRKLGLHPGDLVELEARGDLVIIRKSGGGHELVQAKAKARESWATSRKTAASATEALKAFRSPLFKGCAEALRRERAEWYA